MKTADMICRLILAVIFLLASAPKIIAPHEFAIAVFRYQLLPDAAINLMAIFLPWIELVAAIAILIPARQRRSRRDPLRPARRFHRGDFDRSGSRHQHLVRLFHARYRRRPDRLVGSGPGCRIVDRGGIRIMGKPAAAPVRTHAMSGLELIRGPQRCRKWFMRGALQFCRRFPDRPDKSLLDPKHPRFAIIAWVS